MAEEDEGAAEAQLMPESLEEDDDVAPPPVLEDDEDADAAPLPVLEDDDVAPEEEDGEVAAGVGAARADSDENFEEFVPDQAAPKAKPKKRLVRKSAGGGGDGKEERPRKEHRERKGEEGRRRSRHGGGARRKKKKHREEGERERWPKQGQQREERRRSDPSGGEEAWNAGAPAVDSEDDAEGAKTREDENFIDDEGLEPDERFGGDGADDEGENDAIAALPQAEEEGEDEFSQLFKGGKKRRRDRDIKQMQMEVEKLLANMDRASSEDAELNRAGRPAIEKLKLLPEVKDTLLKKHLQVEFIDRGLLSTLKNWLEPLPDGSLPNIRIRTTILEILPQLPIDAGLTETREMLKKNGLGKVVMFLSKLPEETLGNKKLAKDLVDQWSRPIFQKSTRYEDLRMHEEERAQAPPRKTHSESSRDVPRAGAGSGGGEDDFDLDRDRRPSSEPKVGEKGYRHHASRPQPMALDFVVRPESKVAAVDLRRGGVNKDGVQYKMSKKLQKLAGPKRKNLRAEKVSVEGRGLIKF